MEQASKNLDAQDIFSQVSRAQRVSSKLDPAGYKVVSVRLREAEYEALTRQVVRAGLTNNMALRIAARRIGGYLEIDPQTRRAIQSIANSIGDISSNIHAITYDYTEVDGFDMETFCANRAAFGREFIQLDSLLRSLLSVSKRRMDGCQLLCDDDQQGGQ